MEPILTLPPSMPPHDAVPFSTVPHKVVATWPEGTFVENLAVLDDGSIAVSVLSEARIDHVSLHGERSTLAQLPVPPTGLVVVDGVLYTAAGELGKGPIQIWRIEPDTGSAEPILTVDGAIFLNGLTRLGDDSLIAAESLLGRVFRINLRSKTSDIWCADERLTPSPLADFLPGANGIKRFGGHVYISSNSRALLFRVPVLADGSAGATERVAERLRADDFAFDREGNLYLCTHIGNTLDRLAPSGERTSLAGVGQGMAGSTACAFGRTGSDNTQLYVTTTGGLFGPPEGKLQPAKLVRLDVGAEGASI